MKIFFSVASARLEYGGPAVSVVSLASSLAEVGLEVGLWSADGSASAIQSDRAGAKVQPLAGSLNEALRFFGRPDLIHDNGIWWPHNHQIADFAATNNVCRIVSSRGMLEPWARRHKLFKKKIAWWLYQKHDLRSADRIHVTSSQEEENLSFLNLRARIVNIPNGINLPHSNHCAFVENQPIGGSRQVLFLGRLHPVKGLLLLLRAWSMCSPSGWKLVLAGPDENGHRAELDRQVRNLRLEESVTFVGAVSGSAKADLFRSSDLFVLPSHSESFGIVVGEALSYGLPVLTTRNVPWPQLELQDCGWRCNSEAAALASVLREAIACPRHKLAAMGQRGRALIKADFGWRAVAEKFVDVYAEIVQQRQRGYL